MAKEHGERPIDATVYATTDDGIHGVIRHKCQDHMKMEDGRFFIPVNQDIDLLRAALKYAVCEADMGGSRELPEWIAQLITDHTLGEKNASNRQRRKYRES